MSIDEAGLKLIRETFSRRILQLVKQHAQGLQEIGGSLRDMQNSSCNDLLWTSDLIQKLNVRMTGNDLRSIRSLHLGASDGLQALFKLLQKWLRRIRLTREELQALAKGRWQDKIEEYDDKDEDTAQDIISGLSKDDPDSFLETLNIASLEAASSFVAAVGELSSEAVAKASNAVMIDKVSALLRVIRELRIVFQYLFPKEDWQVLAQSTANLEEALARQTASELFATMESRVSSTASTFVTESLPSPVAVSTLQQLCTIMSSNGGIDLWTTAAVRKLQRLVLERVMEAEQKSCYIHSDFDEHYLRLALGGGGGNDQSTPDSSARKAASYWNRTRTLFGVLKM